VIITRLGVDHVGTRNFPREDGEVTESEDHIRETSLKEMEKFATGRNGIHCVMKQARHGHEKILMVMRIRTESVLLNKIGLRTKKSVTIHLHIRRGTRTFRRTLPA